MPPRKKPVLKPAAGNDQLSADDTRQLIARLQRGESLGREQLLWLAQADVPPCGGACKANTKANPTCFCALAPAEGSFKKKGLWKKEPAALTSLGPDPALRSRQQQQGKPMPAGLYNLGNTCYVNSALQCLFNVPGFRRVLYTLPGPQAEQDIISHLRSLFLALDFGPHGSVDPTEFARALNLNHAIQQDGQEFFKLLLGKVESIMATCSDKDVASVVSRLFRGRFSYLTVCKECGQASATSSTATDFYELPLQVKGHASLLDSLASALSAELLEGDNQYACEHCQRKTDAQRQMVLRGLPPYLCLQLQRFVFDYKKMDKMKVSDKLAFPLELDLPALLAGVAADTQQGVAVEGPDGAPPGPYELAAVLIHKGNSASHGHYGAGRAGRPRVPGSDPLTGSDRHTPVAHIRAPDGLWWRYDDEEVTAMGAAPTSHPSDHGTAPSAGADGKARGKAKAGGSKGAGSKARGASAAGRGRGSKRKKGGASDGASDSADDGDDPAPSDEGTSEGGEGDADGEGEVQITREVTPLARDVVSIDDSDVSGGGTGRRPAPRGRGAGRGRGRGRPAADGSGRGRGRGRGSNKSATGAPDSVNHNATTSGAVAQGIEAATPPPQSAPSCAGPGTPGTTIASSNAYMLLYRLVGWADPPLATTKDQLQEREKGLVSQMEVAFQEAHQRWQVAREAAEAKVEARRKAVRDVLMAAPGATAAQPGKLIPSAWLEAWAIQETPPAWDVKPILCTHGKVDPAKVPLNVKHISAEGWELLTRSASVGVSPRPLEPAGLGPAPATNAAVGGTPETAVGALPSAGGGSMAAESGGVASPGQGPAPSPPQGLVLEPVLSPDDLCPACILAALQQRLDVGASIDVRTELERWMAEGGAEVYSPGSAHVPAAVGDDSFLVSRSWLAGWLKRRAGSVNVDASPTTTIACPHGRLLPKAQAVVVPGHLWRPLKRLWLDAAQRAAAQKKTSGPEAKSRRSSAIPLAPAQAASPAPPEYTMLDSDDEAEPAADETRKAAAIADGGEGPVTPGPDLRPSLATGEVPTCIDLPAAGALPCGECEAARGQAQQERSRLVAGIEEERAALLGLANNLLPDLAPDAHYFMVPRTWLQQWRAYVAQAQHRRGGLAAATPGSGDAMPRPGPLLPALRHMLCPCHPGKPHLRAPPPAVAPKRSRYEQASPETDDLVVIEPNAWAQLWSMYGEGDGPWPPSSPQSNGTGPGPPREEVLARLRQGFTAQLVLLPPPAGASGGQNSSQPFAADHGIRDDGGAAGGASDAPAQGPSSAQGEIEVTDLAGSPDDSKPGRTLPAAQGAGNGAGGATAAAAAPSPARHGRRGPAGGPGGRGENEGDVEAGVTLRPNANLMPLLLTDPPVCDLFVQQMREDTRRAQLSYDSAQVFVELCADDATAQAAAAAARPGMVAAAGHVAGAAAGVAALAPLGVGTRRSRRVRRGRTPLTVACTHTLHDLKLQMLEALDIHPRNAKVYGPAGLLADDDKTLAELEVFPDAELRVVDTGEWAADDLDSVLPAITGRPGKRREVETGFKDTALLSGAPAGAAGSGSGLARAGAQGPQQGPAVKGAGRAAALVADTGMSEADAAAVAEVLDEDDGDAMDAQ